MTKIVYDDIEYVYNGNWKATNSDFMSDILSAFLSLKAISSGEPKCIFGPEEALLADAKKYVMIRRKSE